MTVALAGPAPGARATDTTHIHIPSSLVFGKRLMTLQYVLHNGQCAHATRGVEGSRLKSQVLRAEAQPEAPRNRFDVRFFDSLCTLEAS